MKNLIALVSILVIGAGASAAEVSLKECKSPLYIEQFETCDESGIPCSSTREKIGEVVFDVSFDKQSKVGSGQATAIDANGVAKRSSLACAAAENDDTWVSCVSSSALVGKWKIAFETNASGLSDGEDYYVPIFVGDSNVPNGAVSASENCRSISVK